MKRALVMLAVLIVACRTQKTLNGVVQDNSGKRVVAWIDPMYAQGPPHQYKSEKPGIAPDCGMKLVPQYAETASATTATSGDVVISAGKQQLIGVKLAKAEMRNLATGTRTVGRVEVDERRIATIHSKFEGVVESLYVNFTGQPVRRGDPLLAIYSPDILATQQELIVATNDKTPFGKTLAESARRRLLLWDVPAREIDRVMRTGNPIRAVTLSSPASGVVLKKNATLGARVTPMDTLYEIADLSTVWVIADVYEADIATVRTGQTAQITASSLPGRSWTGPITFVSPVIEGPTRTAKVRIQVDNRDGALKPDMYADVTLQRASYDVLAVPESAVLRTGERSVVFVARGNGEFDPRNVQTGSKSGDFIEIRSGVSPGETVVVDANFLIDSESRLKAAISGMSK